jgi:hypothetical protein
LTVARSMISLPHVHVRPVDGGIESLVYERLLPAPRENVAAGVTGVVAVVVASAFLRDFVGFGSSSGAAAARRVLLFESGGGALTPTPAAGTGALSLSTTAAALAVRS